MAAVLAEVRRKYRSHVSVQCTSVQEERREAEARALWAVFVLCVFMQEVDREAEVRSCWQSGGANAQWCGMRGTGREKEMPPIYIIVHSTPLTSD